MPNQSGTVSVLLRGNILKIGNTEYIFWITYALMKIGAFRHPAIFGKEKFRDNGAVRFRNEIIILRRREKGTMDKQCGKTKFGNPEDRIAAEIYLNDKIVGSVRDVCALKLN